MISRGPPKVNFTQDLTKRITTIFLLGHKKKRKEKQQKEGVKKNGADKSLGPPEAPWQKKKTKKRKK